jgi:peptide/nickel transport system ATP-binding protein
MSVSTTVNAPEGARPATVEPVLQVSDLTVSIRTPRGLVRAVNGVTFDLDASAAMGIVGESGSGKSMLAKAIIRLLPPGAEVGTQSEVLFKGVDLLGLGESALRGYRGAEIAMVFQDSMSSLTPVVRVGRHLTEPLRAHLGLSRADAQQRALELLRAVGLSDPARRFRQYPHELSGGMRQRVSIAIAQSCEPALMIADEPTTALDVTVQQQILDLLSDASAEQQMAMILVTHDLGVAAGRTDKILVLYGGRIVEQAPTEDLFARPRHPYSSGLIAAAPRASLRSQAPLGAIPGRPPLLIGDLKPSCTFAPRCQHAQPRCLSETPELVPLAEQPDHQYACFFPVGTPAGDEALATNLAAGVSAAGLAVSAEGVTAP